MPSLLCGKPLELLQAPEGRKLVLIFEIGEKKSPWLWECGNRVVCDFQGRWATVGNAMSSLDDPERETSVFHRRPRPGISTAPLSPLVTSPDS